jgi:4'-phosphopantetheinyl transferase EntD
MNAKEFEAFQSTLEAFLSNHFEKKLRYFSCRISKSINLFDSEREIIRKAVPKRAYEFSAGRMCARKCLSCYGMDNVELPRGEFGEPLWPEGYSGSITHHDNVAIAVTTRTNTGACIGIDLVSKLDSLDDTDLVTCREELKLFANLGQDVDPGILIFSIKESVIKICSPLLQQLIDFRDVSLSWDGQGLLQATMHQINQMIKVRWIVADNAIFSIAILDD